MDDQEKELQKPKCKKHGLKHEEKDELDCAMALNENRINSFAEINWKNPFPQPKAEMMSVMRHGVMRRI